MGGFPPVAEHEDVGLAEAVRALRDLAAELQGEGYVNVTQNL